MRRSDRRKLREAWGLRRNVQERKLVTAEVRAGRCPCHHPEIENPGPHLPTCWHARDPDMARAEDLPF